MNMEDKKYKQMIIKEHINLGLIEPGVSAYNSLGFLIRNHGEIKRGKPKEHLIDCIKGTKVFSKFDCKSGFYQTKMEGESKKFNAFSTLQGQYIWNVLQMNHIKHLEIFSDACHREGLVLSEKKATIVVNKIEFLGILIDETGIELQDHIVEKIRNFPDILKDKKHLQSFLGVVNFAGIFIKDLAKYRKDFRPLLKETESSKWKCKEIHTQRVRKLKQRPDMVAFNKIKVATGEAPLVSAISEDDISTRRAWGLWVCFTEMDKVKYPFKIFSNKLNGSFLLNSMTGKSIEFAERMFEKKRMLIWENKLPATEATKMKTCNMLQVGQSHNPVQAMEEKIKMIEERHMGARRQAKRQRKIYVEQPQGFIAKSYEEKLLRLKKALYRLKQAPRAWYNRIDNYFMDRGFRRSLTEPTLYIKSQDNDTLIVFLYINDLIYTGNNEKMIHDFKEDMMKTFEMSDLGLMYFFLEIVINQEKREYCICQKKYMETLLKKFKIEGCKTVTTPLVTSEKYKKENGLQKVDGSIYRSLIGSLLYLTATRPDIMFATSLLSRFMQRPSEVHYGTTKRILGYLQGTKDFEIWYNSSNDAKLVGCTDSDWAGSADDIKSTSGYTFSLGSGIFSWASKKQATAAQSSAEAEYIAATVTSNQATWRRRILEDMGEKQEEPTTIYYDNKSAIAITKNPIQHNRTKHIDIKYHSLQEASTRGEIELCSTQEQLTDMFTKALPREKFEELCMRIRVSQKHIKEEY
ncbi:UNVERIFIED_CONTAM: Retrovirus-related Pol polyprotein from transposon RE1 [Sesamum radiatum]|uniref:Retrovirus-related Pol polyprotein from transposon RE1 n=1 Tax=Sesamum radiatum TaxID=300843 RepID=A0AAW2W2N6_SESRA